MIVIELLSGKDCHLCEQANGVIKGVQKDFEFVLKETLLVPGNPLYEKYKEYIPVVHINGSFSFWHHISDESLRRELRNLGCPEKELP